MNKDLINQLVESYINGDIDDFDWSIIEKETNSFAKCYYNTIKRLIFSFENFKEDSIEIKDYLINLRNYLLIFQTDIFIKDHSLYEKNNVGLSFNTNNKLYASIDFDNDIDTKFLQEAFLYNFPIVKKSKKYNLDMPPYLHRLTGYDSFNSEAQKLCTLGILRMPEGYTGLVVLPTGSGKSIITQSIAYQKDGLTVVVVPTISLAQDQEISAKNTIQLQYFNLREIFSYYSGMSDKETIINAINENRARLLFISPEALIQSPDFIDAITEANKKRYLKNLIIDEAHIVIEWGSYFRTEYQILEPWRKKLLKDNPDLKTILLSATVDINTSNLLKKMFSDNDKWLEFRCDELRKEPRYAIIKCKTSVEKKRKIIELVRKLPHPIILYTHTPDQANVIKEWLKMDGIYNVKTYTGETDTVERKNLLEDWKNDAFDIMVATAAFGMGVDKPDVRSVVHTFIPNNPNLFYQELGRGGRDRLPCLSVMCICPNDYDNIQSTMVLSEKKIIGRWNTMYHSPKSRHIRDVIYIDTKLKPDYNKNYVYDEASDMDTRWNIYVLLLLRRYDLIEIVDMEYDAAEDHYIFAIKIKDDCLVNQTEKTVKILKNISSKEKRRFEKDKNMMISSINDCATICISNLFTTIYSNVAEYCSGCNSHKHVIDESKNRFEIHKVVNYMHNKSNIYSLFADNSLIITPNKNKIISLLIAKGVKNIISEEKLVFDDDQIYSSELMILNFNEFRSLSMAKQVYYLSDVCLFIYSDNEDKFNEQFSLIDRSNIGNLRKIHLTSEDFYLNSISKNVSAYISDNISGLIEERLSNV